MFLETNTYAWPIASVLFYRYLKPKGLSCLVCRLHFPRNYTYTPMVKCVHHTTHFRHDPVVSLVNCQSGSWRRLNIQTKTRNLKYMWKKPKLWPWNFLIDLNNLQEKKIYPSCIFATKCVFLANKCASILANK